MLPTVFVVPLPEGLLGLRAFWIGSNNPWVYSNGSAWVSLETGLSFLEVDLFTSHQLVFYESV